MILTQLVINEKVETVLYYLKKKVLRLYGILKDKS